MFTDGEAGLLRHEVIDRSEQFQLHIGYGAAGVAYEVAVFVIPSIVADTAVPRSFQFPQQAEVGKQIEIAVHGSQTDGGNLLFHLCVDLFGCRVHRGLAYGFKDQFPLARILHGFPPFLF